MLRHISCRYFAPPPPHPPPSLKWYNFLIPRSAIISPHTQCVCVFSHLVCEGGTTQAKPDPAPRDAEKGGSRDPAQIEEMWARNAPYSYETWHSRVSSQQSENFVYIHHDPVICTSYSIIYCACVIVWVYNYFISSRRINHCGAIVQYMPWSSVYSTWLSVVSQTIYSLFAIWMNTEGRRFDTWTGTKRTRTRTNTELYVRHNRIKSVPELSNTQRKRHKRKGWTSGGRREVWIPYKATKPKEIFLTVQGKEPSCW